MQNAPVTYTIALTLDPQQSKQMLDNLNAMRSGVSGMGTTVQAAQKQFSSSVAQMTQDGRKLREVGATLAAAGGALLAPLIAAADAYESRYKGLEQTANDFAKAQQRQADATAQLGRVAAQALIPIMNQVADVTQKIAAFASAHPELVSDIAQLGAGAAAAGVLVAAAGQLMATLGRVNALFSEGGLTGTLTKLGVTFGALYVAVDAAVPIMHALGDATGNVQLQHANLADALKTGREIVASALGALAKGFVEAGNSIALVKETIEGVIIGIQKWLNDSPIAQFFEGALPGGSALYGKNNPTASVTDTETANLVQEEKDRQAAYDKANAALADFGKSLDNFVQTGSLGQALDALIGKIGGAISGAVSGLTSGGGTTPGVAGTGLSPEFIKDFIAYQQQIRDLQRQQNIDLTNAQLDHNRQELQAQTDFNNKLAQNQRDYQNQLTEITRSYHQDQAKAQIDFNNQEILTDQKLAFDRSQRRYQLALSAQEAAVEGDVGGFITQQRQSYIQEQLQARQDQFDKQQRQEQFDNENADRKRAYDQQITDAQVQYARQNADAKLQYGLEETARKVAYQNQLDDLARNEKNQQDALDRNFATQIASLNDNIAGMQGIYNSFYAQQEAAAADWSKQMGGHFADLYAQSLGYASATAAQQALLQANTPTIQQNINKAVTGGGSWGGLGGNIPQLGAQNNTNNTANTSVTWQGDIHIGGADISKSDVVQLIDAGLSQLGNLMAQSMAKSR